MAQKIVGLDLGTASVKAVRVEPKGKGGFSVEAYGEALVPPPAEGGTALSMEDRWGVALDELRDKGLLDADVFVTGLPGEQAAVRTLKFPFSDAKKIGEALPFALEAEIPLDLDEIVVSWGVLGQVKKRDGTAETEVLVAFAKKEAVQKLLDLLAAHGVDPRHVEFDALALDDLYDQVFKESHEAEEGPRFTAGGTVIELGGEAPEPAVAMVDVGHRRTSVCVLAGGRVVSAHTILHGGADATRALSKDIGLPLEEAERGKRKEAFIEVLGAKAQFPEQQQISEVLKTAYSPIVRRLRQIFQAAVSSSRVRVVKVYLTGGGSRILNLDRYLAEQLNVKVARGKELASVMRGAIPMSAMSSDGASFEGDVPEAALALSYALSGMTGPKTRARIDFRVEEFAWKGDFDFLRERLPALGAWAAVLLILLAGNGVARAVVLDKQDDELAKKQAQVCKEITGQDIDSATRCLAIIQERISGQTTFTVPERSAVDTYLEISKRTPPSGALKRKLTELDITPERARLKGTTESYDAIDKIVESLQGGQCFASIEKGKARNVKDDLVEFNATIQLDCAAAPGEADKPGEAVPTTASMERPERPAPAPRPRPAPPSPAMTKPVPGAKYPTPPIDAARAEAAAEKGGDGDDEVDEKEATPPVPGRLSAEERAERRERLRRLREQGQGMRGIGGELSPRATPIAPTPGAVRDRLRSRGPVVESAEDAEGEVE